MLSFQPQYIEMHLYRPITFLQKPVRICYIFFSSGAGYLPVDGVGARGIRSSLYPSSEPHIDARYPLKHSLLAVNGEYPQPPERFIQVVCHLEIDASIDHNILGISALALYKLL
jgi:hypothetical protein